MAERIEANPSIMMGKPVIVGTRITVELIIEKLAAGETIDQILAAHPRLRARPCSMRYNSPPARSGPM